MYVMFIKMEQEADFTTWTQLAKVRPWHRTSSPCTDLSIARKHLAVFLEVEVCCPDQAALPSLLCPGEGWGVALPSLGDTRALHLSPGPDASSSLPPLPPSASTSGTWTSVGTTRGCGGSSARKTTSWSWGSLPPPTREYRGNSNLETPPGTVPCHLLLSQLTFWELLALLVPAPTHPSHPQVQEALLSGAHLHGAPCQGGGGGGSASSSCSGADVRLAAVGSEGGARRGQRPPPGAETEFAAALGGRWLDVNSHFRPQNEIWGCLQPPVTISLSLTQGQGASP